MSAQYAVPATPRVTSPSPTPSDRSIAGGMGPGRVTRSASARQRLSSPPAISEENKEHIESDGETSSDSITERRARTRSRSPTGLSPNKARRRMTGLTPVNGAPISPVSKSEPLSNGYVPANGHLSPYTNLQNRWRDFSRSPSPLGLIPLHRHYRTFIHQHEIPRKLLHVSIGFVTLHLYCRGVQTLNVAPWLLTALIPIAVTDFLRHRYQSVNKLYIRCLGALMRETEVAGYNGVIWYLLGAYISLRFFPKDVGVVGVLLLSWCDTAASTFGRLYGRYTVRLRRGKSLAGTLAAWATGVATAAAFWGYLVPWIGTFPDDPERSFMFNGTLNLIPSFARGYLGWAGISSTTAAKAVVTGPLALGIMSMWTGLVAAGSEFIDLFGWDDNLTIPVLSSVGIWGFLKTFG
ncbi:phosphatidate cytidylyltransferase [[Emmonsia] crescens]|uniref:Phosphatidate cytidylyltransferase n=1 Tax=[Emmonsia] crescens TaxID=73230 RepID=A0A0G2J780_9EURO|nr:phosphatidate cytidylyltransferase [Emmonsia crescens UAMH 3008]